MKTTKEEIDNRIEWIAARSEISDESKNYIHFQMIDFAKYYHEQQVKKCDMARVGGNEVALTPNKYVCCGRIIGSGHKWWCF